MFQQPSVELQKILDNESTYESYDMRVMVVGKYGVGKTTLVMLLVGDDIPKSRIPTDGISLLEGRCGLDISSKEWILINKDSYNAKDVVYNRMLMPPTRKDTEDESITQPELQQSPGTSVITDVVNVIPKSTESSVSPNKGTLAKTDIDDVVPQPTEYSVSTSPERSMGADKDDIVPHTTEYSENPSYGTGAEDSVGEGSQHLEIQKLPKSKMKTKLSKTEFKKRLELALKNGTFKMQMGRLFFWDFGGQYVFYTTHQSFMTFRALFLVVFDATQDLHECYPDEDVIPGQHGTATPAVFLQHWVNSILTYCKVISGDIPKILFVATHKDKIPKESVEDRRTFIFDAVDQLFQDHEGRNHLVLEHRTFVNARDKNDPEIESLKKIITELTFDHPCWGEKMPNAWVPLELEIAELVARGTQVLSMRQLEDLNKASEVSVLNQKDLKSFLLIQHSLGKIVYFDTPQLRDFVIISPLYMVEVMKSFVTDKHFWPTDSKGKATFEMMSAQGIITKKGLFSLWKRKLFSKIFPYREFIFEMLVHLDIVSEQRRYDLKTGKRLPVEYLFVPCMLSRIHKTNYLDQECVPQKAVGLAFVFKGTVVPPALPNRLISACLNIWALKSYTQIKMLFSGLVVLSYDKSLEIVIRVESNKILLFLVHTSSRGLIVTDSATSVRECMQTSLERISDFYQRSITGQSSNQQLPFHVQHACPELKCYMAATELLNDKHITCSDHDETYELDVWYQNKKKNRCEDNCEGLSKDALCKIPSDPELLRLSLQFAPEMMKNFAIHLGITTQEWDDMDRNHPINIQIVKYLILIQWREKNTGTFKDLLAALTDMEENTHKLCQVRRSKIRKSDIPEEHLGSIPTDEILDELASKIGFLSFQLGVELGRKVTELENIQYHHKLDLVEQTKDILHKWRDEQTIKATFGVLEQALVNVGKGSMCLKTIIDEIGVKQHHILQHETGSRRRCILM